MKKLVILKNCRVYNPQSLGKQDIVIYRERIIDMDKNLSDKYGIFELKEYDLQNKVVIPGLIDQHAHILGGGGGAGFKTRVPEIGLSQIIRAGITTVVGCLGLDTFSKTLTALYAKVKGLQEEGLSAYMLTGGCRHPVPTVTGDIRKDIILIDPVIGAGEITISELGSFYDSCLSEPGYLAKIINQALQGGAFSGKAGIVALHVGDGPKGLTPLYKVLNETGLPVRNIIPTHVNRNEMYLNQAVEYSQKWGGIIDFTAGRSPEHGFSKALKASKAIKIAIGKGVSPDKITISSDGHGSMDLYDDKGVYQKSLYHPLDAIWQEIRDLISAENINIEQAVSFATRNVARGLKLNTKGILGEGRDADMVVLNRDLNIDMVFARGECMFNRETGYLKKGRNEYNQIEEKVGEYLRNKEVYEKKTD